jgi:hypothetical protein
MPLPSISAPLQSLFEGLFLVRVRETVNGEILTGVWVR